jgi:hypothetical protein
MIVTFLNPLDLEKKTESTFPKEILYNNKEHPSYVRNRDALELPLLFPNLMGLKKTKKTESAFRSCHRLKQVYPI